MEEPKPHAPKPRPCSSPHSAPIEWLRAAPPPIGDADEPEPEPEPVDWTVPLPSPGRHDGWTNERIATFLEVLADTGIVAEGYRVVGMSRNSAYALRNRDPVVAAAWRAAESHARPLVADGLLERSITGTVEHFYRDGVLVGERRHYESWLGLAVLKRLDKQAEEDRANSTLSARMADDWQATLDALRSGGTQAVLPALVPETDKADTLPPAPGYDPADNVWKNDDGVWITTFPPPPGFDGYENRVWDGDNYYERACTAEEAELIEAADDAAFAKEQAELTAHAEAERDAWFAKLRAQLNASRAAGLGSDKRSDASSS